MRKWIFGCVAALAGCLAWAGVARQGTGDLPRIQGAVLSDRLAYVVLPPEAVCGPEVRWSLPSDTGSYALVDRRIVPNALNRSSAPPEMNLVLWDATTRHSIVLWRQTYPAGTPGGIPTGIESAAYWFHDLPAALVAVHAEEAADSTGAVRVPETQYLLVNAGKRTARPLFMGNANDQVIPNRQAPVIAYHASGEQAMRILDAEGKTVRSLPSLSRKTAWLDWLPDGKTLVGVETGKKAADSAPEPPKWVLLDTETGNLTRQEQRPTFERAPLVVDGRRSLSLTPGKGRIVDRTDPKGERTLHPIWLTGDGKETRGEALVAVDGGQERLTANAVYYAAQGTLFSAPIVRLPVADYLAMERARTMQHAKMVGLGLMMYSLDYDENLPPLKGNISEMVSPYLKDDSLMRGFAPLYASPNQLGTQDRGKTAIGSLTGPGGQAIIYADGHVQWRDDKPQ